MVCETSQLDTRSYLFRFVEGESNQGILNQIHTTEMSMEDCDHCSILWISKMEEPLVIK